MLVLDNPPKLWLPEKPAIIRPADPELLRLSEHDKRVEGFVRGASRRRGHRNTRRTFTFVGSCVSTTSALDFSALSAGAVAAGDLLAYIDFAITAGGPIPTSVTPSGFANHIDTPGATTPRAMVSSKKAAGTEASITGMNGATRNNKIGLVFRPSIFFTTITAAGMSSEITTGDATLQTCDPSAETSAVILLGLSGIDSATAAFSTFSPAADGTVTNSSNDLLAGYKIYNTGPQSTSIDMADLGTINWLASLYFTVS